MPVGAQTEEQFLLGLLVQAGRHAQNAAEAVLARRGLRYDLWAVLDLLRTRGTCAMAEIADEVVIPPPTLTRAVDKLIGDGLVHRLSDPTDRRRVLARLTRRGERLHEELASAMAAAAEAVIVNIGHTERVGIAQALRAVSAPTRPA